MRLLAWWCLVTAYRTTVTQYEISTQTTDEYPTIFTSQKPSTGAHPFSTNCPRNQMNFEKTIGLRPSESVNSFLLITARQDSESLTFECITKCWADENCASFVLYYNISQCFWYNFHVAGIRERDDIVIDPEAAWFQKTCLNSHDCDRLWIFDRIPGATLVGNDRITLPEAVTRNECQQRCLDEKNNSCRSAKFKVLEKPHSLETFGICTLSYTDRHLNRNSYRASSYDEEYFENLCSNVTADDFCSYEEYEDVTLSHTDMLYTFKSQTQCEEICNSLREFKCRGYSLIPTRNSVIVLQNGIEDQYACRIHSEDSKIHGPSSLENYKGARFYEKARCLNISVICSDSQIIVEYRPEMDFYGKLYMSGFSEHLECYAEGNGRKSVILRMPLMGNLCGIEEAKSVNGLNRTLLSGNMILQYNRLIQTQGDRLIKVGCIFSHENTIVLGTGVSVGSEFSNKGTNKGTAVFNTTRVQPAVEMRILDLYSQNEISDTQIGQELQLIIEIKPPHGSYDIWAGHLVAMTEDGHDSILLLDDLGCPTNLHVFPGLVKVVNNETNKLTANFQAFKFTSSPIVRFSVIVQFCTISCAPPSCENLTTRKKRENEKGSIYYKNASIKEIDRNQYEDRYIIKMPLEFILVVRNSKIVPDKLVYGENNRILVAGYDALTNEVCFDYSLLIGIIVTWTLIQIIIVTCCLLLIRRYKQRYQHERVTQSLEELHKNFGLGFSNLEPRRVHFADNGDLT